MHEVCLVLSPPASQEGCLPHLLYFLGASHLSAGNSCLAFFPCVVLLCRSLAASTCCLTTLLAQDLPENLNGVLSGCRLAAHVR